MKLCALALIAVTMLSGCAEKKHAKLEIPSKCLINARIMKDSKCVEVNDHQMRCDNVLVNFGCVGVEK